MIRLWGPLRRWVWLIVTLFALSGTVVLSGAIVACSPPAKSHRRKRVKPSKRHKRKPVAKRGHAKHPHAHGAAPHKSSSHHHHNHPHPHLSGGGHHHPY